MTWVCFLAEIPMGSTSGEVVHTLPSQRNLPLRLWSGNHRHPAQSLPFWASQLCTADATRVPILLARSLTALQWARLADPANLSSLGPTRQRPSLQVLDWQRPLPACSLLCGKRRPRSQGRIELLPCDIGGSPRRASSCVGNEIPSHTGLTGFIGNNQSAPKEPNICAKFAPPLPNS